MGISELFIRRPVATTLLTIALALFGALAFGLLPVSPLPQTDSPTIGVSASLPGASPETMASSVATPLERQFGHIAGLTEMTSSSSLGSTSISLQFDLNRNIDAAARDVQAAINAARSYLPANLPANPSWRKSNPADTPIMVLALTSDPLEDVRAFGMANGKPSVLVIIWRQPGANIIQTVDRIRATLPQLQAAIPRAIDLSIIVDQTTTIRASVHDVERALLLAIMLVIVVVFLFLRNVRATLIPGVAVPLSLIGTFGAMYLLGYSVDNLSLMALAVGTGFVVDDAIVVLENVTRHLEQGMLPMAAALRGAREIGFTVLSMSLSLVAVFIPILLMGGIVGRLFREFAVTLSIAILISLVISLTTTPMMCAYVLRPPRREGEQEKPPGRLSRASEQVFTAVQNFYGRTLGWVLRHSRLTMLVFLGTVILNIFLYVEIPKGFFPQQDTGRIIGFIRADQSISFQAMRRKFRQFVSIVRDDPAIENIVGFTGGFQTNSGFLFASLKPLKERNASADQVINRLRVKMNAVAGANLFLTAVQDI